MSIIVGQEAKISRALKILDMKIRLLCVLISQYSNKVDFYLDG